MPFPNEVRHEKLKPVETSQVGTCWHKPPELRHDHLPLAVIRHPLRLLFPSLAATAAVLRTMEAESAFAEDAWEPSG